MCTMGDQGLVKQHLAKIKRLDKKTFLSFDSIDQQRYLGLIFKTTKNFFKTLNAPGQKVIIGL